MARTDAEDRRDGGRDEAMEQRGLRPNSGSGGTHPDVNHAMRTAHHGRGPAHTPEHGMRTATMGRGADVVGKPGDAPAQRQYGPVKSGQKGHPGTD